MKNVYLVSGNKGGVGKSWVALTLIEYIRKQDKTVHIVETDSGNPDVYTPYVKHEEEGVTGTTINMRNAEALEEFVDAIAGAEADCIVVNAAAGDNENLNTQQVFYENIAELDCELTVMWVCNAEKDGIVALKKFINETNAEKKDIVVVMNKKSTENESAFGYLNTALREEIKNAGGREMFFPVLPVRIAQQMRDAKETFAVAMQKNITNKLCAQTFLKNAFRNFEQAGV